VDLGLGRPKLLFLLRQKTAQPKFTLTFQNQPCGRN
jgi:hypothetical protein